MKRRESGEHGWKGALPAIAVALATAMIAVGCQNPLASRASGSDSGSGVGAISGFAYYSGQADHGGIVVSAEGTDGTTSKAVARALNAGTVGARTIATAIAGQTTTDATGAYSLSDLPEGSYTLYASSTSSLERAVTVSVNVTADRSVTAPDLLLTPTGEIAGKATLGGATTGNLGIIVFVAGTSYAAMTDDGGSFTIGSVPAATGYTLVASRQGYKSAITAVDVTAGETADAGTLSLLREIEVTTLAGKALERGSSDGVGMVARFYNPSDAVYYSALWVTDTNNHTIRTIDVDSGVVTTLAGTAGSYGSADGSGAAARFYYPTGIAAYGSYLYVTDTSNHTVRKVETSTSFVATLAGTAGSYGSADGSGAAARFYYPTGIAAYGNYLYVTDTSNHTIRKVEIATGLVTTLAGTAGSYGSTDGLGVAARFRYPEGITAYGGYLFVADRGNHTIRKIEIATGLVTTLAGTAGMNGITDATGAAARFYNPKGISSSGGVLLVADSSNHTIRKIVISTGEVTTAAGTPRTSGSIDGIASSARFNYPSGVVSAGTGFYVVDRVNNTIRRTVGLP